MRILYYYPPILKVSDFAPGLCSRAVRFKLNEGGRQHHVRHVPQTGKDSSHTYCLCQTCIEPPERGKLYRNDKNADSGALGEYSFLLLTLEADRWASLLPLSCTASSSTMSRALQEVLRVVTMSRAYRKCCVWSMLTDAEIPVQLCPLLIRAQSICFMTHESQQACSSANRPICRLGGRALCGKPALTTVHPHTDPWKAGSSAEGEGASLPAGILPSEQMGPSPGSSRTRMSALAASVFLICL